MDKRTIRAGKSWEAMRASFRWPTFETFNMAQAVIGDWAAHDPTRPAIIQPRDTGAVRTYSYGDIWRHSAKLANIFAEGGLGFGDRVAILLGQGAEALVTHMATYRSGGIVVPLFTLFGEEALSYRLVHSGAKVVVTDHANLPKILAIRDDLPNLQHIFSIDGEAEGGVRDFWAAMLSARVGFETADTTPDTPALLVYTSGTTGPPKGALHGHRVVLGHLPGVETHHDFFPATGDCAWTPADWAWMGGLADILLPSLYLGVPVVAHRAAKFDPDQCFDLIRDNNIRNVFFPPTALKVLRAANVPSDLNLRSVASGGEALGAELLDWGKSAFGLNINEFYGSTECNLVLGNCASCFDPRPGSTGKPTPGKDVAVIDADGNELPVGEVGDIAVKRGDPAMFLEYWQNPERTTAKFTGDWLRLGDEGAVDEDGYFHFSARSDDVIMSAGYRIGPSEIEDCLTSHNDVTMAAAIGMPDAVKGEVVKAFVVLREGATLDAAALSKQVRDRLSPHVAPKEIEAIDALPMTATGKIMRRELKDQS